MRITSFRAENMLSFDQFDLEFSRGLNVIVGPNGAGKSNVLRLIGLVATSLKLATSNDLRLIDVDRYIRFGTGARTGKVSLGIELTEAFEKSLLVGLVRGIIVSSVDRDHPNSPAVDSPFEQELDARVRARVSATEIDSLLRGRLVLHVDAGPPPAWALAYEFDYQGETYHWGITGSGLPNGWVASGSSAMTKRTSWGGRQADPSAWLTSADESRFTLDLLLPSASQMIPWEVKGHPSGKPFLVVDDLARALGLAPKPERVAAVYAFDRMLSDGLVLTANLRRPPRRIYDTEEAGLPVRLEDAGDLPLELYRRMVSSNREHRASYREVQSLFTRLTGQRVEITASVTPAAGSDSTPPVPRTVGGQQLQIEPLVVTEFGDVSIENAGAGMWEALVACTAAVQVPGRVVLLDEPAVNLYPSWQRRLLTHLEQLDQVVLITHSPYLVPASRISDLATITRLYPQPGGTAASRLADADVPADWRRRWRQILVGSADARAALLAQGVILLEGDTELGVFGSWFADSAATGDSVNTPDSQNYLFLVVGSDSAFGAYVSFLNAAHVPWAIICDGPVLSPKYKAKPLLDQLREASADVSGHPDPDASFTEWKTFWSRHGVFTVADRFGGVTNDKDKSGEIEAFLKRTDETLLDEIYAQYGKSKTRAGHAFAEEVDLQTHPDQQVEIAGIWSAIKRRLGQ